MCTGRTIKNAGRPSAIPMLRSKSARNEVCASTCAAQGSAICRDASCASCVLLPHLPPLSSGAQVSLSAFAFLFSECIQYSQQRVNTVEQLQTK